MIDDNEPSPVTQNNQFSITPRVVSVSSVSVGAKALYSLLAQYAGVSERAWPSRALLAQNLGVSVRTVSNYTKELVDAGFVAIKPRMNSQGLQAGNYYYLGSMVHQPAQPSNELQGSLATGCNPALQQVATRRRTIEEEPLKKRRTTSPKNYEGWIALAEQEEEQ